MGELFVLRPILGPVRRALITSALATAVLASGCGTSMDHSSHMSGAGAGAAMNHQTSASGTASGHMTDPMFVAEMIPHHQAAIDMGALAPSRAEHSELKALAAAIASAQASEIALMKKVGKENSWDPNAKMQHSGSDGMSKHEMGMDMDVSKLKTAKPFDKAFIEMMVPHHEGAITMAKHEISRGSDSQIRDLADRIIASQTKEIKQMKQWYQEWYGQQLR